MMDAALRTTTNNLEVVHVGWLIKSPPTKLWKARWRQRWFTLRHSGELPGQYFLEYYEDTRCRKLKGRIDLDQCEQVDAGLSLVNRRESYQYMFNVKTPKRIYYLVAESETDMNKWVDAICQVCGLKAYTQDEEPNCQIFSYDSQESPSISPTSIMSGPYIPISECISGPCLYDTTTTNSPSSVAGQAIDNYDLARRLVPSPPRSPATDADSIITDDESLPSLPNVNWDTFPSADELKPEFRPCNTGIGSWSVKKRFGKLRIVDSDKPPAADEIPIPPRPPKPLSHVATENPGHNYLNLDGATESSKPTTPSTPAQQTSANNELHNSGGVLKNQVKIAKAPMTKPPRQKKPQDAFTNTDDHVFRYDFDTKNNNNVNNTATTSPHSPRPSSLSNEENANAVPKIAGPAPPLIFRELKPGKKTIDSNVSIKLSSPCTSRRDSSAAAGAAVESVQFEPPTINRKLKPPMAKLTIDDLLQLSSPPGKEKLKPTPSPTFTSKIYQGRPPSVSDDDNNPFEDKEEIYFYQDDDAFIPASARRLLHLQYLDLDLEKSVNGNDATLALPSSQAAASSTTVYKTVDFVKTEAFNRTRQKVERERKQCTNEMI